MTEQYSFCVSFYLEGWTDAAYANCQNDNRGGCNTVVNIDVKYEQELGR